MRIVAASLLLVAAVTAQSAADTPESGAQLCLSCHDFGADSPIHAVQAGSHGTSEDPAEMIDRKGCQDCHGNSADHTRAPTQVSPAVSFGPRWTATTAAQDSQCLACHEEEQAAHWQDALHMLNNLSCVTCHDIHSEQDTVLFPATQAQVCTQCHKAQKKGMHGLSELLPTNPPCSSCHNPHNHEAAENEMLANGSQGCRSCHDLEQMDQDPELGKRAKRSHKRMSKPDYTCLDCHQDIAHAPADAVTAMVPTATSNKQVTLFYPGMADSDWLLQGHPGSQPLRQGRNCQQCHRGEEESMGQAQAAGLVQPARDITVAFSRMDDMLRITLSWQGPPDDASIALMWGDGRSEEFRRGGCFAACHSDMPGMSRDNGAQTEKYLPASRLQQGQLGQPALVKSPQELAQLMAAGEFVELWRVQLGAGKLEVARVLDRVAWGESNLIQINKSYMDGSWTVELTTPLNNTESLKPFDSDGKYTFGIALNGPGNKGGKHWVSLPLTLSFAGDETDFKVEQ